MIIIVSKIIFILIILPIESSWCFLNEYSINTTTATRHKIILQRKNENLFKKWQFQTDDSLEYPRGDKPKLRRISALWSEHYACLSRVAATVTESGNLPGVHVTAFVGAVARLPCGLCVAPNERGLVKWIYSVSPSSKFEPLLPKQHIIKETNGNLTIYSVREDDTGVYMCTIGNSVGGAVILDIVNRTYGYDVIHDYEVVKEVSSYKLKLTLNLHTLKLFEDFPGGIPCHSRYIPPQLHELPYIGQRRNEIKIGLCKPKCDNPSVFEVRSLRGIVLERANNSAGIYSLWQQQPLPTSRPLTRTVFAPRGDKLNISCPGISFRDIPLTWRVGVKIINPRILDRQSAGRVHLNARDELAFSELTYSDANLYSCWQRDVLVGTVKLVIWEGPQPRWNHHVLLFTVLFIAVFVLREADRALLNKKRRLGML